MCETDGEGRRARYNNRQSRTRTLRRLPGLHELEARSAKTSRHGHPDGLPAVEVSQVIQVRVRVSQFREPDES